MRPGSIDRPATVHPVLTVQECYTRAGATSVTHLIVGHEEHGVTRLARELSTTASLRSAPVIRVPDGIGTDLVRLVARASVHVHVTDRLFGHTAAQTASTLIALGRSTSMSVTLHDLPQPSDGPDRHRQRASAYADILAVSRGVALSSHHESTLLDEVLKLTDRRSLRAVPRAVIPLPIESPRRYTSAAEVGGTHRDLAVFGFLYPGKGHAQALRALSELPADVGLTALGRPSPGHGHLVEELQRQAHRRNRRFTVTGYIPDDRLQEVLARVAVPVAPHQHLSASGSINSWLTAGRRPLVPRSRYVEELDARCPDVLTIYDDLAAAARHALDHPESTTLRPGVPLGPSLDDVGALYAKALASWHH